MPEDRRLAAIMFTDIVGYTTLMGRDEDVAFDMLARNHALHVTLIEKHKGILIKEIGDGTLASFPLASNAVRCAIDIQKEAKDQNIPLKIGIHEGEMVFAGGDVLGDGVNIASRLQEDTQKGCINISASVYGNIRNKADIQAKLVGEKSYKNVDEPIKVYKVLCEEEESEERPKDTEIVVKPRSKLPYYILTGVVVVVIAILVVWEFVPFKEKAELEKSIAVLPFKNFSNNPDDLYLADGMQDAILNHLQRINDLRVRSRTSTEKYRKLPKNMIEIGQELEVSYLLEGSFQKVGNKANLIVQLIDAKNDEHLWAEEYNRDWSDIFAIQKEIAQLIVDELYINLSMEAKEGINVIPTDNMTAYENFLKGNELFWTGRITRDITKFYESLDYYKNAIELDDKFSYAYTGLGRVYWLLAHVESEDKKLEFWKSAKSNLQKAINLDPYNGWAYSEMGVVLHNWNCDSAAARKHADMALKLAPNDPNSYHQYIILETRIGNCNKVEKLSKKLKFKFPQTTKDPHNEHNFNSLRCQQNWSEIATIVDEYWDDWGKGSNRISVFMAYLHINNTDKAKQILRNIRNDRIRGLTFDALLYAKKGNRGTVLDIIDSLQSEYVPEVYYASIYAALKDKELMYDHLEKALEKREFWLHMIFEGISVFYPYREETQMKEIWAKSWTPIYYDTEEF